MNGKVQANTQQHPQPSNSSLNTSHGAIRNTGTGYGSGNESSFLPEISRRIGSKSSNRTQQTVSTDMTAMRKASPEALALMIKNIKNNKS